MCLCSLQGVDRFIQEPRSTSLPLTQRNPCSIESVEAVCLVASNLQLLEGHQNSEEESGAARPEMNSRAFHGLRSFTRGLSETT